MNFLSQTLGIWRRQNVCLRAREYLYFIAAVHINLAANFGPVRFNSRIYVCNMCAAARRVAWLAESETNYIHAPAENRCGAKLMLAHSQTDPAVQVMVIWANKMSSQCVFDKAANWIRRLLLLCM